MDSAELSFVRCPACRSLVPAASNRCRMCGSSLEGLAQTETKEEPKNGRVRQHTSVDDPSVSEAIEKVRTESQETPKPTAAPAPAATQAKAPEPVAAMAESSEVEEDPLKAYLEDFEDDDDDDDDLEDLLSDDGDDDEPEPVKASPEPEKKPEPEQPRVVVEQGSQRKSGGLSFGSKGESSQPMAKPKVETKAPAAPKPAPQPVREAAPKQQAKPQAASTPKPQPASKRRDAYDAANESTTTGQLFGWFVSFASPEGASLELREGRFFITNSNVRRGDLVLHDDSVSSPHALVTIGSRTGLTVQDLMSENGLFIKRAGEDSFYQERETAELAHGDSVRFGNVEFLVCLVPNGNA